MKLRAAFALLVLASFGRSDARGGHHPDPSRIPVHYAGNALDQECARGGLEPYGRAQFFAGCPLRAPSPDGRWTFVQTASRAGKYDYQIYVEDAGGHVVGDVPGLADAMPYVLVWSPRPNWFAVSHHVGSFQDRPEIFQITSSGIVKHDQFAHEAAVAARKLYPCMPDVSTLQRDLLHGWMYGWSRDGKKIAWRFTTDLEVCLPRDYTGSIPPKWQWDPFLMISDVETGRIDPGSLRLLSDENDPAFDRLPTDGPYSAF